MSWTRGRYEIDYDSRDREKRSTDDLRWEGESVGGLKRVGGGTLRVRRGPDYSGVAYI